jgi:ribosome-associated protein
MDIRKLQRAIVDGLEDVKAQNIAVFNTEHLSALFERVIIASGTSNRQTRSLASSVREAVKDAGFGVPRMEGEANGEWIIVDCGAAVVHVMQPTIREYYHLEELWGDKPVRMKIDTAPVRLVKAAAVAHEPARKTPHRKAAGEAVPAKKPAAKKAAGTASPRAGAKAGAVRQASAKPRAAAPVARKVTRVVGVKSSAAAAPAAKRPAAKKAPARRKPAARG